MRIVNRVARVLRNPHTHNKIEGGRGGGKSRAIAAIIVKAVAKNPLNVLCCREVQRSLADSSFAMIRDEIHRQGYGARFKISASRGTIECLSGGRIVFIGLLQHTVDSIKSYEGFHWSWIEEAQSISEKSLNVLIPTLRTDGQKRFWFGDGAVYTLPLRMFFYTMNPYSWDDPINLVLPDSRDDVQKIVVNYYHNDWFPASLESERVQAKENMHPDEYNRIWEGVPFEDAEQAIIPRAKIEAAMKREASRDGGRVVSADVARFGADRTQIYEREGMQVISEKTLTKKDTQASARVVHDLARGCKIMVDDTGVGGGVTDKLRDLGDDVTAINFGGKAKHRKKYPDIISEMWFELAGLIDEIGLPDDQELLQELSSRHFKYTSDERRKVESKEDYKKRTGRRSPDKADSLIMLFYNRGGAMSVESY